MSIGCNQKSAVFGAGAIGVVVSTADLSIAPELDDAALEVPTFDPVGIGSLLAVPVGVPVGFSPDVFRHIP